MQDTRYAVRGLRKTPGFTSTVILVLALGVGANASMYSLVDRLFFREPSGIVDPGSVVTATEVMEFGYSQSIQAQTIDPLRKSVKGLATVVLETPVFQGIDRAAGPRVYRVTDNYFPMLGVRMARGRPFSADEGADSLPVAVVSYRYWERELNGDSAVLGHSIELAKQRYTVIGVAAPDFQGTTIEPTDVWLPMSQDASGALIMRLTPGVTPQRIDAAMTVALRQTFSGDVRRGSKPPSIRTSPLMLGRQNLGAKNPALEIILRVAGVAVIILLVSIANVATLLLMRATRRRREIAVRLALGVSRGRLVRQLVVEGLLLSIAAGAAALLAAGWGGAVARARFMYYYRLTYPLIDWQVVTFTIGVAVMAGLVASLAPAVQASRPDLTQSLKAGARGHYRRSWFRGALVVAQAALSVVLVVGAGLFVQSLHNIRSVPLGIDVDQLVVASVQFARGDSGQAYIPAMEQEAARLSAMGGVHGAAVSLMPPMEGEMGGRMYDQSGDTMKFGGSPAINGNAVGPGYFATVGMRVLDGRDFTSADAATGARVVVVSESAARDGWPGRRAIGQCVLLGRTTEPCATIVGVVSDANLVNIKPEPPAHYYIPITQETYVHYLAITMRAGPENRATLLQTVRHDLADIVPASATLRIEDLRSALDPRYAQWTEGAAVFTAMGLLALIVAAIGMYSIIGYSVSQRMHEMGIRVALGARRDQVMRPVILGGVKLAALGVALGVGASLAAGKLVASLLYDTSPRDPLVMAGAALVLLLASVAASFIPARRAARVDPVIALRAE